MPASVCGGRGHRPAALREPRPGRLRRPRCPVRWASMCHGLAVGVGARAGARLGPAARPSGPQPKGWGWGGSHFKGNGIVPGRAQRVGGIGRFLRSRLFHWPRPLQPEWPPHLLPNPRPLAANGCPCFAGINVRRPKRAPPPHGFAPSPASRFTLVRVSAPYVSALDPAAVARCAPRGRARGRGASRRPCKPPLPKCKGHAPQWGAWPVHAGLGAHRRQTTRPAAP